MAAPYRIGVMGFGVAGGTAAYLLSSAGHDVSVLERAPEVGPVGAGILLQPSGQLVLKRLGMVEAVTRSAEPIHELYAITHRRNVLVRLPYSDISPGCHAYGVHRGTLFNVIHRAALGTTTKFVLGCEIVDRKVTGEGVYAVDRSAERHGPFDFLVVADGSRSALRSVCGIKQRVHTYPYGAIWGIGNCNAVRERLFQVVEGTDKLIGLLPIGDGKCTLFASARPGEWAHTLDGGFVAWRDALLKLCPQAEEVFESLPSPEDLRFTDYRHVWMQSWHDDRVVFLGDSAHSMSPHLGQGVNLALLDAESFTGALSSSTDFDSACAAHETARQRHITFYSRLTYLLSPFFQSGNMMLGIGRDIGLPAMARIPWVRRQMARAMGGISQGLFRDAINIEELQWNNAATAEHAAAFLE